MTSFILTIIFLSILAINSMVQFWLSIRNKRFILKNANSVPEKFKNTILLEEHQKAAKYTVTKIKNGNWFRFFEIAILIFWLFFGGLETIDSLAEKIFSNTILIGVTFFLIFGLASTILGLPESIYSTFVTESRFGFNKTTPKLFIMDLLKSFLIGFLIGIPVLATILWIMGFLGKSWWLYAWLFLTIFQLLMVWIYPVLIAPIFNKFTELEDGETKNRIQILLDKIGIKSSGIFVMDASRRSSHGNAYFTGFGKNKRIVFFDTLINGLDPREIEAVLAHELGHLKKKHILKSIIKSTIFSFLGFALLGYLYTCEIFYTAHGINTPSAHMALALFIMVSPIYTFFTVPMSSWLSRKQEFEADKFAARYSNPADLISSLVKMYRDNASTLTPDPIFSAFYHSHPPATERIKYLESMTIKE